jgi:acetyltransferase
VPGIPVYPNLNDLPAAPDLAVVVTPDDGVCDAVGQCARAGVTGVVVISGARRPRDAGAADVERRLREELRYGRMRMIGPGCCALMNSASGLNVSPGLPMPVAGSVAFLAQSGSHAATILDWARRGIVGFSAFVSLGALVDVGWGNLIDYFGSDPNTRSILVHMESVVNIRSFLSAAREIALQKPILVVKAGRTEAAARTFGWYASSHVSDDDVIDAAFRRVGVLRVDSLEDSFSVADALSKQPRPRGPRLVVVSNAGGPGVLAADHVVAELGVLSESVAWTPPDAGAAIPSSNRAVPMDVLGDGSSEPFLEAVRNAIGDRATDGVLLLLVPQVMSDPVSAVQGLLALETGEKPVLLCMTGPGDITNR